MQTFSKLNRYRATVISGKWWFCVKFLLIFALFFSIAWQRLDLDFGWHLQAGNYIREHGIPNHDVFTYSASNFHWINHEWGNDVIVSYLYQWGGYGALAVLFSLLWALALFLSSQRYMLFMLVLATTAISPFAGIRAVAWTVFGLAITLRILNAQSRRLHYLLPLLIIPWANVHAGFVIALFSLAYFAFFRRAKYLVYILILSVLASFVNPYGPRLYEEIIRTIFDPSWHHYIKEWKHFNIPLYSWTYIVFWGAGFWLFSRKEKKNWAGLSPLFLAGSFSANRNVPLFIVTSLSELENYYVKARQMIPRKLRRGQLLVISSFVLIVMVWVGLHAKGIVAFTQKRELTHPTHAVDYLREHPCDGNIFNLYNYGGYLIWKLPGQKVYIDGRMPSWRDESNRKYMDRYSDILDDSTARQKEFERYNIRCAVLHNSQHAMINDLKDKGWEIKVNANEVVLVKP